MFVFLFLFLFQLCCIRSLEMGTVATAHLIEDSRPWKNWKHRSGKLGPALLRNMLEGKV